MKKKEEGRMDGDAVDYDPQFAEMDEDHALEAMKKENPGLYALMKKHGAEVDDADEKPVKKD